MAGICRIYKRTSYGVRLIAEVRGGRVTGRQAGTVRKMLRQCGFPNAPIELVIDQLLLTNRDLGAAIIPDKHGKI